MIAVAGLRHAGTKVGFSDIGPEVAIAAPGGNCVNTRRQPACIPILTALNTGTTTPVAGGGTYSDGFDTSAGHQLLRADGRGHRRLDTVGATPT